MGKLQPPQWLTTSSPLKEIMNCSGGGITGRAYVRFITTKKQLNRMELLIIREGDIKYLQYLTL